MSPSAAFLYTGCSAGLPIILVILLAKSDIVVGIPVAILKVPWVTPFGGFKETATELTTSRTDTKSLCWLPSPNMTGGEPSWMRSLNLLITPAYSSL
jgi:hypothetical protein